MPGDNKQPLWQRILMGGAVAEAPSVMTAAGHKIEKDGTVTVDNQNNVGVKQLRSSLPIIGASAAISVAAPTTLSAAWKVLNHPITQTIGTIDGFRNLFTGNGVQKTYNHFKNEEYGRGTLSLAGDILDASPLIGGVKATYNAGKALYNGDKISNVTKNLVQKSDIGKILFTPKQYFNETKINVVDYLLDSDGKWLDKPIFGMNFVMNRRLPKKELDRIWHNVHNYNEIQKTKYGYYNNFIPFRTGIVRVPTWREQLNNIISNTPSNVGPVRAGAINRNGEITLFAESLFKPNIKGTMAHEYRHDVQRGFSGLNLTADIHSHKYSQLQIPTTIRPSSQFEALFKLNENPNLKHAQKLLGNTNKTDDWFKELHEFDAELANLRERYKINLPWTELHNNVQNKMIKWLSNRFGISPEDVNSIATDLANNAYKNGGKLWKKQ